MSGWFGRWKNKWKDTSKGDVLRQNTVGVLTADVSLSSSTWKYDVKNVTETSGLEQNRWRGPIKEWQKSFGVLLL